MLGDCRRLLGLAAALGERAQRLRRRGCMGVLKVAASPQFIESVFARFLHVYAERYPAVQVKLFDVLGPDMLAMFERGDIDLGQSLVHAVPADDGRFASLPLRPPVEILAASSPDRALADGRAIEIDRRSRPTRCCCSIRPSSCAGPSTPPAASSG